MIAKNRKYNDFNYDYVVKILGNDDKFAFEFIQLVPPELKKYQKQLPALLQQKNWSQLFFDIENLCGLAAYAGMLETNKLCKKILIDINNTFYEDIGSSLELIQKFLKETEVQIEMFIKSSPRAA